jgi:hypothetical protein
MADACQRVPEVPGRRKHRGRDAAEPALVNRARHGTGIKPLAFPSWAEHISIVQDQTAEAVAQAATVVDPFRRRLYREQSLRLNACESGQLRDLPFPNRRT